MLQVAGACPSPLPAHVIFPVPLSALLILLLTRDSLAKPGLASQGREVGLLNRPGLGAEACRVAPIRSVEVAAGVPVATLRACFFLRVSVLTCGVAHVLRDLCALLGLATCPPDLSVSMMGALQRLCFCVVRSAQSEYLFLVCSLIPASCFFSCGFPRQSTVYIKLGFIVWPWFQQTILPKTPLGASICQKPQLFLRAHFTPG